MVIGWAGSRPGNSQPCGRAAFHQAHSRFGAAARCLAGSAGRLEEIARFEPDQVAHRPGFSYGSAGTSSTKLIPPGGEGLPQTQQERLERSFNSTQPHRFLVTAHSALQFNLRIGNKSAPLPLGYSHRH